MADKTRSSGDTAPEPSTYTDDVFHEIMASVKPGTIFPMAPDEHDLPDVKEDPPKDG